MHSAAGGTNQRLKPAFATVCSRSRMPAPLPDTVPAVSAVAIYASTGSRPSVVSAFGSRPQAPVGYAPALRCFAQSFEMRRDQESAFRNRHTLRPIGHQFHALATIMRFVFFYFSLMTACIGGVTQPPPVRGVNSIGAEACPYVDWQMVATCGRERSGLLQKRPSCKGRMAKLRL